MDSQILEQWQHISKVVAVNTERVVHAFRVSGLTSGDLAGSTGYGYDDRGRLLLDNIVAQIFGCESALVRPQWVSGTHALATALMALARPQQTVWLMTGDPYDTIRPTLLHLRSKGVDVTSVAGHNHEDLQIHSDDVVYIQRSRGYAPRKSWGPEEIAPIVRWAHQSGAVVVVDNCYGEFTQGTEPGHWGADLVVGSLMKNPGGTIAPTGAYIAGRRYLVNQVADHFYAPGIGGEVGATAPYLRLFAQGFFLAPQMVGEALCGGIYISHAAQRHGIHSEPLSTDTSRNDIVVALDLESPERVIAFCQAIQAWEPVDAMATPEAWAMPGYEHPIIMAAGGFVAGGSLELSADAPMREPYRVYIQGGVNRWHTKLAIDAALDHLRRL
ncbi:MAG: aluminum resistance protein [Sulfobacillus acidophilus]|uniref:Aluminum resistance protein n=1 Tax=Sulfobacillus acidophilus TaxID=53633 RepID=A0A2T2WES6_9FIRM|nr:MAG: aluminum resistance protein [Sulfobacillus acidophilus]